jgi:integrase
VTSVMVEEKGVYQRADTGRWVAALPDSIARQLGGPRSRQFEGRLEAVQWRRVQMARAVLGQGAVSTDDSPVADHMAVWMAGLANGPTAKHNKQALIDRFVTGTPFGDRATAATLPMHIDEVMAAAPPNLTRVHLATLLSVFFRWAYNNNIVAANPYPRSQADTMRTHTKRMCANERKPSTDRAWTLEQLYTFLDAETDPLYLALWETYAATGERRGEGVGLRWEHTDLDAHEARLVDNIVVAGGTTINTYSPKNGVRRRSYFGPYLAGVLEARRAEQQAYKATCLTWARYTDEHGQSTREADWVFDRRQSRSLHYVPPGTHLHPGTVYERFHRLTGRAGLPELSGPHGLRRTFATLIDNHEDIRSGVLVGALGHTPDVSLGYARATPDELREVGRYIDGLLAARHA